MLGHKEEKTDDEISVETVFKLMSRTDSHFLEAMKAKSVDECTHGGYY